MRNTLIYGLFILLMGCVKSNPVPTTPPTPVVTIPNAPTDLKGALMSSTQIDLTWTDASNNEDGFKIERKSGTDAFSLIATLGQNVVTYSDKGFTSGPTFSYRVYSYNTKGNSNNTNELSIVTLGVPKLTTKSISDTTAINALSGGTVTSDGGGQVTARGVVWSTSTNPTIALSTKTVDSLGIGGYNSFITGLTANTKYYVRAYATNAAGTGYGNEISFTSNTINIPNGLAAYYPFTGNAGDSSGNGNHGIVNGATLTIDRFGKSNAAYSFNGTSSFIDVTTKFFDNGWENSTVTVWFNTATHQSLAYFGGQTLISTNCFNGFGLGYSYQASKRIYVYKNSNPAVSWDILKNDPFNFTPINLNTWYFLTVIKSGLSYTYYINGQLDKTITTSIAPSVNNMYPIRIGGVITPLPTDNRELFTGNIDDIRIYNRVLTSAEITYLYNH